MSNEDVARRIIDNYLYNASLAVSLTIVIAGVLLCLMALVRRDERVERRTSRIEDGPSRTND